MATIDRHLSHGRPGPQTPDRIVIHAMGYQLRMGDGSVHYAASFLEKIGLSAHALVAPNGDLIRCRHDHEIAWHAKGHNTNTLGLEFLVPGVHDYASFGEAIKTPWPTTEQLDTGAWQVAKWCRDWPIKLTERHSYFDPERKVDPGAGFPWETFLHTVDAIRNNEDCWRTA